MPVNESHYSPKCDVALISIFGLDFGIRSISAYLKSFHIETALVFFKYKQYSVEFQGNDYFTPRLLDHELNPKQDIGLLIGLLRKLKPKIVGISVGSSAFVSAKHVTRAIKENTDALVVWGGVHAIISPQECLQYADIVCTGEGEIPMLELVQKLQAGESIDGIHNLWLKTAQGIKKNPMRALIEDLDALPFADFLDRSNKYLIDNGRLLEDPPLFSGNVLHRYPIMTSRGCLYKCSYCCNSVISERYEGKGSYLRRRSVDHVVAELKHAAQGRVFNEIRFWDDVFTYDIKWIKEFCEKYRRQIGKPFLCYAHPKNTSEEIFLELKKAGLVWVSTGIQSGSEKVAKDVFFRNQSNREIIEYSKRLRSLDISVCYDLITDNPYETEEDQEKIVDLLLRLPYPYQIHFYSLCWFPETPLTKKALSQNLIKHGQVEDRSPKALNNFFMYLPLSLGKANLFWNCLKAMAVNRLFPKWTVWICKNNILFKICPKMLFLMARGYLQFARILSNRLVWKKKRFVYEERQRVILSNRVVHTNVKNIEDIFITGRAKGLFKKAPDEFYAFISDGSTQDKRFSLRVFNASLKPQVYRLVLQLVFASVRNGKNAESATWNIDFEANQSGYTDVQFELQYPHMTYLLNNARFSVKAAQGHAKDRHQDGVYWMNIYRKKEEETGQFITKLLLQNE